MERCEGMYDQEMKCNIEFDNWVALSDDDIVLEYNVEYKHHVRRDVGDVFPAVEPFIDAVKKAQEKPVKLTREMDSTVGNRSRCKTMRCIIDLISTYRSYPEFRNEKTVRAIDDAYKNNRAMKMPILLDINGRLWVMSGNTRIDLAFINGIEAMVIVVPVRGKNI